MTLGFFVAGLSSVGRLFFGTKIARFHCDENPDPEILQRDFPKTERTFRERWKLCHTFYDSFFLSNLRIAKQQTTIRRITTQRRFCVVVVFG